MVTLMPFQIKTGMFHDEELELRRVDKKLITILEIGVAFYPITTVLQLMQARGNLRITRRFIVRSIYGYKIVTSE